MGAREIFILSFSGYMALALFAATRYKYRETHSFVFMPLLHSIKVLAFGMLVAPIYLLIILYASFRTTLALVHTILLPLVWLETFIPGWNLLIEKLFKLNYRNRNELFQHTIFVWKAVGDGWDLLWEMR